MTRSPLRISVVLVLAMTLLAACSTAAPPSGAASPVAEVPTATPSRALVVAIRVEPPSVATRPLRTAGIGLYLPGRVFNASIGLLDNSGKAVPYLVEALPQLNTDSWQVSADGTMMTSYHLKPNLTWHDGQPLTADDFVFAYRVYTTRAFGASGASPFRAISDVVAQDPRTFVIHWTETYPDVSFTSAMEADFPLPAHVLQAEFQPDQTEAFANDSFWTQDYVGVGPYRLTRWEPGAFIEGEAFAGHALGKPRIDRIRMDFSSDARAVLAKILSGDVQLTDGTSVGFAEVSVLRQDWIPQGKGNVIIHENQWRAMHFQNRPDLATPPALLNRTIRKALAHAVDKQALNDSLYYGLGVPSDSVVAPTSIWGKAAEQGAVKYPYDLKQTDQLMQQAGYSKGGDGTYTISSDGRLSWTTETNGGSDNESEMSIIADGWRQAGFDVKENVLSAAEARDPEKRSTFPATFSNSQNCCQSALQGFTSASVSTQATHWTGDNRSGWSNPDYDRLAAQFAKTIDQQEREKYVSQMVHVLTDDLESVTLMIRGQPWVYVSGLKGLSEARPEGNMSSNIYEWELR